MRPTRPAAPRPRKLARPRWRPGAGSAAVAAGRRRRAARIGRRGRARRGRRGVRRGFALARARGERQRAEHDRSVGGSAEIDLHGSMHLMVGSAGPRGAARPVRRHGRGCGAVRGNTVGAAAAAADCACRRGRGAARAAHCRHRDERKRDRARAGYVSLTRRRRGCARPRCVRAEKRDRLIANRALRLRSAPEQNKTFTNAAGTGRSVRVDSPRRAHAAALAAHAAVRIAVGAAVALRWPIAAAARAARHRARGTTS